MCSLFIYSMVLVYTSGGGLFSKPVTAISTGTYASSDVCSKVLRDTKKLILSNENNTVVYAECKKQEIER